MKKSNYNKFPSLIIESNEKVLQGWADFTEFLTNLIEEGKKKIVIECYHGVDEVSLVKKIQEKLDKTLIVQSSQVFKSTKEIDEITFPDVTNDRIFGRMTELSIGDFIDKSKLKHAQELIENSDDPCIVLGLGASELDHNPDIFIYVDLARWEIQQRMRREEVANIGTSNFSLDVVRRYKRAYFVDWRICDQIKKKSFQKWDYVLDLNKPDNPKLISKSALETALGQTVTQPFRLVPFFDPGPWGGQWMREVFDLDPEAVNFAWGFDCVPEENSILYNIGGVILEFPASNVVFFQSENLLGRVITKHFGAEFPIRFDFLDTMEGGNLSLQVHPMKDYIKSEFGMEYTQDESYYILEAGDDGKVYLGLKDDINPKEMISALQESQENGSVFDADKYTASWPAKKHDHFLIPAGTVHCSGRNTVVLEISATPYIFTFKLYDWGRLGLDGLPRPINIERGEASIQWNRDKSWVGQELIQQVQELGNEDSIREEKTGLHETQFIETIRTWFSKKVLHKSNGNLNVLNLVEGDEVLVESPTNSFSPMHIHYAETFVIPAAVEEYTISPIGKSVGKTCATLKAYVKEENL